MSATISLVAILIGQEAPPADLPQGTGPRATSQSFGTSRYDAVGYAGLQGSAASGDTAPGRALDPKAVAAAHPTLPLGSFVEVTSLDSGRTILAMITARAAAAENRIIDLSSAAAELLGIARQPAAAVRVRLAQPPVADQIALRDGRAASPRLDATRQLVAALRKQLPPSVEASPPPTPATAPAPNVQSAPVVVQAAEVKRPALQPQPQPPPSPSPQPPIAAGRTLFVQVASFSTMSRARALATRLHGSVQPAGASFRVRLGPFSSRAAAASARVDAARQGFGDAQIIQE